MTCINEALTFCRCSHTFQFFSPFSLDDNVNYASRWRHASRLWKTVISRLQLEWQPDRETERVRAMRQLQMELLDSMSQRMDNAAAKREEEKGRDSAPNMRPENALSFPPPKQFQINTNMIMFDNLLMSIKGLIYMHRKSSNFCTLYLYIFKKSIQHYNCAVDKNKRSSAFFLFQPC